MASIEVGRWPSWLKGFATAGILLHGLAVLAGALAAPPSSPLERRVNEGLRPYQRLVDQGYAYRFYTAGAPPTPIVEAELRFDDGRVEAIRIPDPEAQRPRLRYQRHLALAFHLFEDVRRAPRDPRTGRSASRWASSYAAHLCGANPGCTGVTLYLRDHRNPTPAELIAAAREGRTIDAEGPAYYSPRQEIGAYRCDD